MTRTLKTLAAISALGLVLLPIPAAAQSQVRPPDFSAPAIARAIARESGSATAVPRIVRKGRYLLVGGLVGAGAGVLLGEIVLGVGLDIPHGLDMAVGAAIGAGVGLLIGARRARAAGANARPGSGVSVTPIVGRGRKGVFVTLPIAAIAGAMRSR